MTVAWRRLWFRPRLLLSVCAWTALAFPVVADAAPVGEAGRPYYRFYSPQDYGAHKQNWSAVQGPDGVLYVANNHGVLQFDGAGWEIFPTPNNSIIRPLALGADGRLYLGAQREFGYLERNASGRLNYTSLSAQLPEDLLFTDIYSVAVTSRGVFFQAKEALFEWSEEGGLQTRRSEIDFLRVFELDDEVLVTLRSGGIYRLGEQDLELVPGLDATSLEGVARAKELREHGTRLMIPWGDRTLVVAGRGTLFLYDGRRFAHFPTDIDELVASSFIYSGVVLEDGTLALGTLGDGLFLLDRGGRLIRRIGLDDRFITNLFVDRQDGLWAIMDGGLARIEIPSPLTHFDEQEGLRGDPTHIVRHEGALTTATNQGVYRLEAASEPGAATRFTRIFDKQSWSLLSTEAGLLIGSEEGLYQLAPTGVEVILDKESVRSLLRSKHQPNRAFAGLKKGLGVLALEGSTWHFSHRIPGITETIHTIVEEPSGNLWLGTHFQGVLRVRWADEDAAPPVVERFGAEHGLLDGEKSYAHTYLLDGLPVVGNEAGLFIFREGEDPPFVPHPTLQAALATAGQEVFQLGAVDPENIWIRSAETGVACRSPDGSFAWDPAPFARLPKESVFAIFAEADGVVWLASPSGLVRYDSSVPKDYTADFPALVRAVTPIGSSTAIDGRSGADGAAGSPLEPGLNALRFRYAAPSLEEPIHTVYRSSLGGFDAGWSAWTTETHRDYTNLPAGGYTFRVEARNLYDQVSQEATYAFTLLAPWYLSRWVLAVYIGLGLLLVAAVAAGSAKWRNRRLETRALALEGLVQERTAEVERQARKLAELDAARSRFFANITHEFRTPLTLTLGPLQDLRAGRCGSLQPEAQEQVDVALRNSSRLLGLVEELLDTARMEAGELHLQARERDLGLFVRHFAELFRSSAQSREIAFRIRTPSEPALVYFDDGQMEKILANLLGNAFKFTPRGGSIEVEVTTETAGQLALRVSDSGPGIPPEVLPHVFDRFYQADDPTGRSHGGAGIGLALTRELVEFHGGAIDVESPEGEGTRFTVRLLAGSAHLGAEQIVEITAGDEEPASRFGLTIANVAADSAAARQPEEPPLPTSSGMSAADLTTVLVVDDHAEMRTFIRRHLEESYSVIEAADGAAGVELARRTLPDLIVSDVMMPELDGFELCRTLRQDPETDFIPVILLTARATSEDVVSGLDTGADDYVAKPFDPMELEARVRGLIHSRRHLKARFGGDHHQLHAPEVEVTSADQELLARIRMVLEENLGNSDFTVHRFARETGMERTVLYRRLRSILGESPTELMRRYRLERAAQLLEQGLGSVSEVAYAVGFASVSHFSKCFRDRYDTTPSAWPSGDARPL